MKLQRQRAPVSCGLSRPWEFANTFESGPWDSTIRVQTSAAGYLRVPAGRLRFVACNPLGGRESKARFGLWREQCQTD